MGPRDNDLVLRDGTTNLTATDTLTKTLTGGVPLQRLLMVCVLVPSQSGTNPTLDVKVDFTDTNKKITVTAADQFTSSSTYPKLIKLPLPPTSAESLQVTLTVGGTSPNFGGVECWVELAEYAATSAA